jgi:hypothetical protein
MAHDAARQTLLDRFIREADVRGRHETTVRAPAAFVYEVARDFDLRSVAAVRAIFDLRAWLLGSRGPARLGRAGFVAETLAMGWGRLHEEPGRCYVAGAICRPWLADVVFTPLPPERFARYREPDRVRIAWTLEVEPLGAGLTRLATETRAHATDPASRARFLAYWRRAGVGIVAIRWLLLPAIRREAERRWRGIAARDARGPGRGPAAPAFGRSVRADRAERAVPLPGDDILPGAIATMTHAITLSRPRHEVWPWLVQMGTGRAGWYSYDTIDNGGRPSADRLLSEYQGIGVGTVFPAGPRPTEGFHVLRLRPERHLILGWVPPGVGAPITTWAFVLREPEPGRTRLLVRVRVAAAFRPFGLPPGLGVPLARAGHHVMQRRQLVGIARRVESRGRLLERATRPPGPSAARGEPVAAHG